MIICEEVRCPDCQNRFPITKAQLGSEMPCPWHGCTIRLKVNPFTVLLD